VKTTQKISSLKAGVAPVVLGFAMLATPVAAQTSDSDTIVVTGSRIARPELQASVPVAVVDNREIAADAAQNISDTLNELPQVALGSTRTNTNFQTSGTGIATVNLRNLGSSRTMTLVNGRRFIGGYAGDSAVDLNNIPTEFIERIEIVTGGSSAVYGSDAIAGVVNFILKDKIEGIQVRTQLGVTDEGDNNRQYISATAGTTWGSDDRGNFLLSVSYDKDGGLRSRDRAISAQDCANLVCGPASYSSYAAQGRFALVSATEASRNILTSSTGAATNLFTFNKDNSLVNGFPVGYGFNRNGERYIGVPIQRYLATGIANYQVSDTIKAFAEVTYSRVRSNSRLEAFALDFGDIYDGDNGIGISITNPFIPSAIKAAITAANSDSSATNDVAAIQFRRRQNEVFDRSNQVRRDTWRVTLGLEGELADKYKWDVSYVYGQLNDYNASEDIDNQRYFNALNATTIDGQIVCADATARAQGCVPINLFGYNTASAAASAYVKAVVPKSEDITNKQHVASASFSGPLFEMPAGAISFALGAEYRKETSVDDLDALTNIGGNSGNQIPDTVGKFDLWEVFGELNVPLLKDAPFAKYLGLNGAVRYSDYSSIGNTLSWNAGAEWAPFEGLRLRGVYSEANRAPNIGELFTAPSETFASVSDPCDGVTATTDLDGFGAKCRAIPAIASAIASNGIFEYTLADLQSINGFVGGNIDLQEEKAKTYTLGAVLNLPQFPRLIVTADYFNIKVDGAISTLGRSYSISQCLETGLPVYCDNVTRSATTGFVEQVNGQLINVAGLETSGIDFGLRYAAPLGLLSDDRLSLAANYTYLISDKSQGDPTDAAIDYAGTFGSPRHRVSGRLSYAVKHVSVSWQTTYRSGGEWFKDYANANAGVAALNNVKDYMLHDLNASYTIGDKKQYEFFMGVDNVFDKKPQYLPGAPFGTPTGLETAAQFDVYGRRFYTGVRVKF